MFPNGLCQRRYQSATATAAAASGAARCSGEQSGSAFHRQFSAQHRAAAASHQHSVTRVRVVGHRCAQRSTDGAHRDAIAPTGLQTVVSRAADSEAVQRSIACDGHTPTAGRAARRHQELDDAASAGFVELDKRVKNAFDQSAHHFAQSEWSTNRFHHSGTTKYVGNCFKYIFLFVFFRFVSFFFNMFLQCLIAFLIASSLFLAGPITMSLAPPASVFVCNCIFSVWFFRFHCLPAQRVDHHRNDVRILTSLGRKRSRYCFRLSIFFI